MFEWIRTLLGQPALPQSPATHPPTPTTAQPPGDQEPPLPAAPGTDPAWSALQFNAQTAALRWVFGLPGQGAAQPDAGLTLAKLADIIEHMSLDTSRAADWVPRVPKVLPMLLRGLRNEHSSAHELAQHIEQDVTLLAEALKEANSALYQRSTPVSDTEEAVRVLGHHGLRLLVARVAFRPVLGPDAGPLTRQGAPRLWALAEVCAQASRDLAPARGVDAFEAHLSALAFHVGHLVALRMADRVAHLARPDPHGLGRRSVPLDDGASPESDNQAAQDVAHVAAILSHRVAARWELPEGVVGSITAQVDTLAQCHWPEGGELLGVAQEVARLRLLAEQGLLPAPLADCSLHLPEDARTWLLTPAP